MKPIKVCLAGADGRMGNTIIKEIENWPNIEISGALTASDSPNIGKSLGVLTGKDTSVIISEANNIKESLRDADIYLSFTTPQAEIENFYYLLPDAIRSLVFPNGIPYDKAVFFDVSGSEKSLDNLLLNLINFDEET